MRLFQSKWLKWRLIYIHAYAMPSMPMLTEIFFSRSPFEPSYRVCIYDYDMKWYGMTSYRYVLRLFSAYGA